MTRTRALVMLSALAILIYYAMAYSRYYELKPVILEDERLVFEEEYDHELFAGQMIEVLDYYAESYRVDEHGKIMVSRRLISDMELLWNYTMKARDRDWLEAAGKSR